MQINIKNFTIDTKIPLLSIPENILNLKLPDVILQSLLENHLQIRYIASFDKTYDIVNDLLAFSGKHDEYFESFMDTSPRENILKSIMNRNDDFIWTFIKSSNTIVTADSEIYCEFILDLYFSRSEVKNELISEVLVPLKLTF